MPLNLSVLTHRTVLGCLQSVADMTRVHLSVQLCHQAAADCVVKIIAEHIPEVSSHNLSLCYLYIWCHTSVVISVSRWCFIPCLDNDIAFGTCCRLHLLLGRKSVHCSVASQLAERSRLYAPSNAKKRDIAPERLLRCRPAWLKRHNFWGSCFPRYCRDIPNHHLIAYSLRNISAKNWRNRLMYVEVIVCNISVIF